MKDEIFMVMGPYSPQKKWQNIPETSSPGIFDLFWSIFFKKTQIPHKGS